MSKNKTSKSMTEVADSDLNELVDKYMSITQLDTLPKSELFAKRIKSQISSILPSFVKSNRARVSAIDLAIEDGEERSKAQQDADEVFIAQREMIKLNGITDIANTHKKYVIKREKS